MKKGSQAILAGILAYLIWGFSPLYWRLVQDLSALGIVGHRIVWSLFFILIFHSIKRDWSWMKSNGLTTTLVLNVFLTSILLGLNWYVYIYAVNSEKIVDASLGYFINPLVNVLMGVLFFREKLRIFQWISVSLAGAGVLYLTLQYGNLPWIGLVLAFTFGSYGLLKKKSHLSSLVGFTYEMIILFVPSIAILTHLMLSGYRISGGFWSGNIIVLMMTGLVTGVPLLLFGVAAKGMHLSTLGFIQYIAPTMQLMIGIFIFVEDLSIDRLVGFGFIWLAIILYTTEGLSRNRRKNQS